MSNVSNEHLVRYAKRSLSESPESESQTEFNMYLKFPLFSLVDMQTYFFTKVFRGSTVYPFVSLLQKLVFCCQESKIELLL